MKIITRNPIIIDYYSNAIGDKLAEKIAEKYGDEDSVNIKPATQDEKNAVFGTGKKAKTGFFSKGSRDARQDVRQGRQKERKDDRIATRTERKANRKKKYGARPLNPFTKGGKKFYEDNIPKLKKRKKANGTEEFVKLPIPTPENPNPAPVVVPAEQTIIVPPPPIKPGGVPPPQIIVDKQDLDNQNLVDVKVKTMPNGEQKVVQELPENKTETIINPDTKTEETYKKSDIIDKDAKDDKKPMSTTTKVLIGFGGALILGVILYFVLRKKDTGTNKM